MPALRGSPDGLSIGQKDPAGAARLLRLLLRASPDPGSEPWTRLNGWFEAGSKKYRFRERTDILAYSSGHAPLITELAIGEIRYRENGESHYLAVAWGFAEVLPNRVTILAETAERAEEINARRAEEAKNRAEERLKGNQSNVDCACTLHALKARLNEAGRRRV